MSLSTASRKAAAGALGIAAGVLAAWAVLGRRAQRRRPLRREYLSPEALWAMVAPADPAERAAWEQRFLTPPGAVNLRDAGGHLTSAGRRMRQGRVFRAGHLAHVDAAGQQALAALRLRTIVDLRTPSEAGRAPDQVPAGAAYWLRPTHPDTSPAHWLRRVLFRRHELDEIVAENYLRLVDEHAATFGDTLRTMADPANLPLLVHCTAGKDRTGLTVAFLQLLLGIPDETVLLDYALSNLHYDQVVAAAAPDVERLRRVGVTPMELRPIMTVDPRILRRTLAHLRARHGSLEAYLLGPAGLTPEVLARLRAEFLEE